MNSLYQPSEMTHDELAEHAMRAGTSSNNDALWEAGWNLSKAVDSEDDSEELAAIVISKLEI